MKKTATKTLEEIRYYTQSIEDLANQIERFFHNSNKQFYLDELEELKNNLFDSRREIYNIYKQVDKKLDELEEKR